MKIKKYRVSFKRIEYGVVEVEAIDKEKAFEKAIEKEEAGNANWGKEEKEWDDPIEVKKFEHEEDPELPKSL